jgi:hypothetical protein
MRRLRFSVWEWMVRWLTAEGAPHEIPLSDFPRLAESIQPGDVVLVEGRTRIGRVIRLITQSPWTHAALSIGRLADIRDPALRRLVTQYYPAEPGEQLLIEALIGEGTRICPLTKYRGDHLRICRPRGLCPDDAQRVIAHAVRRLGSDYDVRQLLDLARFFLPWGVLPRRWRSSLFEARAGGTTRTLCSCLVAEAFDSVGYPILPFVERREDGSLRFFKRNPRLFTPRDFDYSPYFELIKFPLVRLDAPGDYRRLRWSRPALVFNDGGPSYRASLRLARANGRPAAAAEVRPGGGEPAEPAPLPVRRGGCGGPAEPAVEPLVEPLVKPLVKPIPVPHPEGP